MAHCRRCDTETMYGMDVCELCSGAITIAIPSRSPKSTLTLRASAEEPGTPVIHYIEPEVALDVQDVGGDTWWDRDEEEEWR